ncbi:MAG: response regulator [Dehalococcoidia bacterium]
MRVLLVDDDPVIRRLVSLTLVEEGYEVHTAEHGEQALAMLDRGAEGLPDLIVLDLEMPVLDGRGFYEGLLDRGLQIPVLVLSAFGAHAARRELGAEASLDKPFDPFELVRHVRGLLPCSP